MRRFFTPGWLGLHALAITLVGVFLAAGWWQLQRAEAGNMRSWGYVFEWPLFAVFAIAMWVKMMHDELTADETDEEDVASTPAPAAPSVQQPADEEEDEELAAYNRYLARLNAETGQRR